MYIFTDNLTDKKVLDLCRRTTAYCCFVFFCFAPKAAGKCSGVLKLTTSKLKRWNRDGGFLGPYRLGEKKPEACGSIVTSTEGCERAWAEQEVINGGEAAVWKAGRAKVREDRTTRWVTTTSISPPGVPFNTQREWKHAEDYKNEQIPYARSTFAERASDGKTRLLTECGPFLIFPEIWLGS